MAIEGSASIEIDAPIEEVFEVAADVEESPRWQPDIKKAEVKERDADGRQVLVRTETDAKVRTLGSNLRFTYDAPNGLTWRQEKGDLKSVEGSWTLRRPGRRADPRHLLDGGRPGPDARRRDPRPAGGRHAQAAGGVDAREAQARRGGRLSFTLSVRAVPAGVERLPV